MTHLKAVKPKSGLPIHEEPQHSYTLPSHLYLDENIYEQEKRKIFYCNWHYAGHLSQLSKSGDYLTATIADESIFIVHGQDDTLRGFSTFVGTAPISYLKAVETPVTSSVLTMLGPMH